VIVPDWGRLLGLVVAGGIEGEFADERAVVGEDAHVPVGDEQADGLVVVVVGAPDG
jgi:hypothetical protein